MAQEAPGAPLAKAMAVRFDWSAGADDVPAVRLLRRRAVDTLTDALHELSGRGFAPRIAQRLQQAIGLLQGPGLGPAYDQVRYVREHLVQLEKASSDTEVHAAVASVVRVVKQGALLARELLVLQRFSTAPAGAELGHEEFKRHMEEVFWRLIDTELLAELCQAYSIVVSVGKRRAEFDRSRRPLSERPMPIRVDSSTDAKLNGQYRFVALVNNASKYKNESNDCGVFI